MLTEVVTEQVHPPSQFIAPWLRVLAEMLLTQDCYYQLKMEDGRSSWDRGLGISQFL